MARSRTAAVTTVVRDAADILTAKLNEIEGLAFVRDAWENKAPDNYGVVELEGEPEALWADDRQVDCIYQMSVHIYVSGGGDEYVALIESKLAEVCDGYSMPLHEYAYDINRNHWQWRCRMFGPLRWTEEG